MYSAGSKKRRDGEVRDCLDELRVSVKLQLFADGWARLGS